MSALSSMAMFLELTREGPLRKPGHVINDTAKRSYTLSMLMGDRPDQVVRTGDKIVQELKLLQVGNAAEVTPGERRTITGGGSRVQGSWNWRFAENHKPINDKQTTMNRGMDQATILENFANELRDDIAQDHIDFIEGRLWGPTDVTMETGAELTNARPFSIPTVITEQTAPVGLAGTGTLAGVNFTTYPNWDNQRYGYDSTDPFGANGLLNAFDWMQLLTRFKPPTGKGAKAFSPDRKGACPIFTNLKGVNLFKAACRAGNDRFFKAGNDPAYPSVDWNGVEIEHAAQLDAALLAQSSGTAYSSAVYEATKPRFFWVPAEYVYPCFHPEHYMNEKVIPGGVEYPDTEVIFNESMWQLLFTSRRRCGLICPSASWVTNSA